MSGLCGIVDFGSAGFEPEILARMARRSGDRAPDGLLLNEWPHCGIAHLLHRSSPTGGTSEKAGTFVCLDGRLDNRADLIQRLRPLEGNTISDAGLLLEAYRRWDQSCVEHLLGDFALALWDSSERRLLAAVDSLGMKPFHFAWSGEGKPLVFASDALQVLAHPAVDSEFDLGEVAAFLGGQIEHPERSFFASVRRLAPAQCLIATMEGVRVERYWHPRREPLSYRRQEEYAEHFRALLERSVSDRLRSPSSSISVAMSGGLDSTSVAALAQKVGRKAGKNVRAYSFVFDRLTDCDERPWSSAMTAELELSVEPIEGERAWSLEKAARGTILPDTPFLGWRTLYLEIFRRMSERGSKVLLMGHGGDDLLRGSLRAYADRLRKGDWRAVSEVVQHAHNRGEGLPRALYRYFGQPFLSAGLDRRLRKAFLAPVDTLLPGWTNPDFARLATSVKRWPELKPARTARQEIFRHLISFPSYRRLVHWHDRNAAALGFEVRHPFLDRHLFEFVLSIPGNQLFRLGQSKTLLRQAMAGSLPERIRNRSGKTRFTSFLDSVLLTDEVQDILSSPRSVDLGILDAVPLQSAYRDFQGVTGQERSRLWHTVTFELWLRRCKELFEADRTPIEAQAAA